MQNQFTTSSEILEVIGARRHELRLQDTNLDCSEIEVPSIREELHDISDCSFEAALGDVYEHIPSAAKDWDCLCVNPWSDESPRDENCENVAVPHEYADF